MCGFMGSLGVWAWRLSDMPLSLILRELLFLIFLDGGDGRGGREEGAIGGRRWSMDEAGTGGW